MAPKCYICRSNVPKNRSIFRIPDRNDEFCERSNLWLKILDTEAKNIEEIRICSEHFLESNYDITNMLQYTTLQKKFYDFLIVGLRFDLRFFKKVTRDNFHFHKLH